MHNAPLTLQCSNPACQVRNPLSQQFCYQCQTFLPKRYLWAIGNGIEAYQPGDLLADRYHLLNNYVLLDTQPGLPISVPTEISPVVEAYLRLSPYRLHVPQVYGLVQGGKGRSGSELLLLELAPIYPAAAEVLAPGSTLTNLEGKLMPELTSLWSASAPLRQLNWLWQIAQLWQPFSREQVTSTLLNPALIRVDGGYVRLLQLEFDTGSVSLSQLGQFWSQELSQTESLPPFIEQLCDQLIHDRISHPNQLLAMLDRSLATYSANQTRRVQIATRTDQGSVRQRNEDACYPPSGTHLVLESGSTPPIVIVCDGIGGHEGGNVASNLAITTIQEQLKSLPLPLEQLDSSTIFRTLEEATLVANDVICQRNDAEGRQERQRMGTTVVMGLVNAHDLYITHVGDSRAYRITRTGCYQVTLDDDVASREVRLGYALYRDALQQPAAGSLIQALGMSKSSFLHPTVQRFVLDEDCVLLLCSDGLSDYDRIEECWATDIVPLLDGKLDLLTVTRRLVEIANTRNGHDNVTVGLIYCQVLPGQPVVPDLAYLTEVIPNGSGNSVSMEPISSMASSPNLKTQLLSPPVRPSRWLPTLISLLVLAVITGLVASLLLPRVQVSDPITIYSPSADLPSSTIAPSASPSSTASSALPVSLTVDSLVKLKSAEVSSSQDSAALTLLRQAGASTTVQSAVLGKVGAGSILRVVGQQGIANQGNWLHLKVCSTSSSSPTSNLLSAGASGWQQEQAIVSAISPNFSPTPEQVTACGGATSPSLTQTLSPRKQ